MSIVTLETAVQTISEWAKRRQENYVCVRDAHGVKLAAADAKFREIHHCAGMVTPDGMPLVWLLKLRSKHKCSRVCGADLLEALCEGGEEIGLRHFFYGGKPGVAEALIANLKRQFPRLAVAGFCSPPFRSLTLEEDEAIVNEINKTCPDVVWVGLSTPKQEFWMRDHVGRINGATLIGVGAAFDFHSGAVVRAPRWLRKSGFEWVYRFLSEPRRLGRRYLTVIPWFLANALREQFNFYLSRLLTQRG